MVSFRMPRVFEAESETKKETSILSVLVTYLCLFPDFNCPVS